MRRLVLWLLWLWRGPQVALKDHVSLTQTRTPAYLLATTDRSGETIYLWLDANEFRRMLRCLFKFSALRRLEVHGRWPKTGGRAHHVFEGRGLAALRKACRAWKP